MENVAINKMVCCWVKEEPNDVAPSGEHMEVKEEPFDLQSSKHDTEDLLVNCEDKLSKLETNVFSENGKINISSECEEMNFKYNYKTSIQNNSKDTQPGEQTPQHNEKELSKMAKASSPIHFQTIGKNISPEDNDVKPLPNEELIVKNIHETLNFLTQTNIPLKIKRFKCELCSYAASRKWDLQSHLRFHSGEKPHKCELCSFSTSRKSDLHRHSRIHSGDTPFKCERCSYKASRRSDLEKHLRIHSGEKPFKCEVCSYKASQKCHLQKHLRSHSGEKPFKCEVCPYKASQKSDIRRHLQIHSGDKPFKCELCSYSAYRKYNLQTHLQTH